jgi:tetratricopeptide (TPR) repeat protein
LADELSLDDAVGASAWLEVEFANLLALTAYTDIPGFHYAGFLAAILAPYLDRRGLWSQAVEILSRAQRALIPQGDGRPDPNLAQLFVHLTAAHVRAGALEDATASATAALDVWRGLHDYRGQADALLELGRIHWRSRRLDEAIEAYRESEALYQRLGLPHGRVLAGYHSAISLFEQHRYADAVDAALHALEIVDDAEDPALKCEVLINLAELYQRTGQDERAGYYLRHARGQGRDRSDPQWLAALALNTGILEHRAGDDEAASRSLHTALDLYRALGDRDYQLDALTTLAAAHASDDLEAARSYLWQAEQLLADAEDGQQRARIETTAADISLKEREVPEAVDHLRTAIDLASRADAPLEEAHARQALSGILAGRGEKVAAHRQHRRAQSLYRRLGHADAERHTSH